MSLEEFTTTLQEAYDVMKEIDEDDTPFLALALSIENDGIWSNDTHFEEQSLIKVYKTKELLHFIEE